MRKPGLVLALLLSLTVGFLVSCQAGRTTLSPTATLPSTMTLPALTPCQIAPTATASAAPTPVLSLDPAVAEAFPLQEGAIWRYQAHIEEGVGGQTQVRDEIITERVISQTQQGNVTVFASQRVGGLNAGRFYYLVQGNRVYQVSPSPGDEALRRFLAGLRSSEPALSPIFVFPLRIGASWGAVGTPMPNHGYEWYVEGQEPVDVPAGYFEDCYRQVFRTNPDDTTLWFCSGVGLAHLRYRHHGSVHNEDWELVEFPGMAIDESSIPYPAASPTHQTPSSETPATPVAVELIPPLIVESEAGRLYLSGLVDGTEQIVALAATDGRLLARYNISGTFGVDSVHGRLYVDQNDTGLAVLDAQTGALQATISLPGNSNEWRQNNPAPQADPATGQVLAFRDNVVYLIDPNQGAVVDTIAFDIPKGNDCRTLTAPLPIEWAEYDSARRLLYLNFTTHVCTPWIGETIVAYDLNTGAQVTRQNVDPSTATAYDGCLYGSSWYRMGVGFRWAWRDGQPWFESAGWSNRADLYIDSARGRLYESSASNGFRVFDAETMALLINIPRPVEGELVGHDPKTDQLYFLSEGELRTWPANAIQPPSPERLQVSSPPIKPVRRLFVSPTWPQDRTLFGLWDYDLTLGNCYVFGASGGLLYLSSDGGDTWRQSRGGLQGSCERVSALAVSPGYARDQTILAGIVGKGIFKSTNGGRLWQPSSVGLPNMVVSQLLLSPGFEHDQIAFARAGRQGELYRSTDGGDAWQALGVGLGLVAMSPEFDQDQVLMGTFECQVLLSRDGGDSWERVGDAPEGTRMLSIAPLFGQWQVVYASSGDTLYRSVDGGRNWQAILDLGGNPFRASSQQIVYGPETPEGRLLFLLSTVTDDSTGSPLEQRTLYHSEDAVSWRAVELPSSIQPTALAMSPDFAQDGLLFVGTADGQVVVLEAATLVGPQ